MYHSEKNCTVKIMVFNVVSICAIRFNNIFVRFKVITTNSGSSIETQNVVLSNETVKYEIETDNCDNFPTLKDFHNFRKQRDIFYECLNLWQSKHLQPSWTFESALTNKILRLLTLNSDPVNMMHLVRLFCTQLVNSTINKVTMFSYIKCIN